MATSLIPVSIQLTGNNQIYQGTTWKRVVQFSADMSAYYDTGAPNHGARAVFVSGATTKFATHSPPGNVHFQWLSTTQLEISISASESAAVSAPVTDGTFQVESVNSAGEVQRILTGTWTMDKEAVTTTD